MNIPKIKFSDILFAIIILLLIIPQTRKSIQVFIHKGFTVIGPSIIKESEQKLVTDYAWELRDQDGNIFSFQDTKGKVVFLNFWATWCPPCIAEMPSIVSLYDDYKEDVVFLLVTDEDSGKVPEFMSKNNYDFRYYNAMSAPSKILKYQSIPQTYIIDKNGKIVIDKNGAANWNSESVRTTLNKLLKKE